MPAVAAQDIQRDTVFISQAMPEDTDFGAWLAVQLARQGYSVWSEAAHLVGGERFWRDIEEAFQSRIAKTIVAVSPAFSATRRKDGMEVEVSLALRTAKRLGTHGRRFVQPVFIGGVGEDDIPAELAPLNGIDFSESWASGLQQLLKALERDKTPKTGLDIDALGEWVRDRASGGRVPVQRPQTLATNTCPITSFPKRVWFYGLDGVTLDGHSRLSAAVRPHFRWPVFEHQRLLGTFAEPDSFLASLPPELGAYERGSVETEDFIRWGCRDPAVSGRDARNHVTGLTRKAWDIFCSDRGMLAMQKSSGACCWFYPAEGDTGPRFKFIDVDGTPRRKGMHGIKNRKQEEGSRRPRLHWHYAPSAHPSIGAESHVLLVPHVAFTVDGRTLEGDPDRAHRIRRSFCKSWWNKQWRTLHLAYIFGLAGDTPDIALPVCPGQAIRISAQPNTVECAVSYELPIPKPQTDSEKPDDSSAAGEAETVPDEDLTIPPADVIGDWDEGGEDET